MNPTRLFFLFQQFCQIPPFLQGLMQSGRNWGWAPHPHRVLWPPWSSAVELSVAHEACSSQREWSATWDCSLLTGQHPFALSLFHEGLGKEINMLVLRQKKNYIKSFPPLLNRVFPFFSDVGRVSKTPKELLFFLFVFNIIHIYKN